MTGLIFLLGGLGLAGLPPSGTWAGKTIIEEAGGPWVLVLAVTVSALAPVLRVWLRVFRGAGSDTPPPGEARHENAETQVRLPRLPWTMLAPGVCPWPIRSRYAAEAVRRRGRRRRTVLVPGLSG